MGAQNGSSLNSNNQNIKSNLSKITFDGLFNENYFKIDSKETNLLLNLELSHSRTKNPFNNKKDYFLGLMIKSKYDGEEINESIDISIALDISNSMNKPISSNLYNDNNTRIELAKECLSKLVLNLKSEDKFSLLIFNENIENIFKLSSKNDLINNLKLIKEIKSKGNCNLIKGLEGSINNLKDSKNKNKRIILITDLQNEKKNDKLISLYKKCTNELNIPITIISITNSNNKLAHKLSLEKGCNYFTIERKEDLENYLIKSFKYICYPIAYNFYLEFESSNMVIEKCIGSGFDLLIKNEDAAPILNNNNINEKYFCKISSCFPSQLNIKNQDLFQKGGIILLKVKPKENINCDKYDININLVYSDRNEEKYFQNYQFKFNKEDFREDEFSNKSIENAVSLFYFGFIMNKFLNKKKKNNHYCTVKNKESIENFLKVHYNQVQLDDNDLKREYLKQLNGVKEITELKNDYIIINNINIKEKKILPESNGNKEEAPSIIQNK